MAMMMITAMPSIRPIRLTSFFSGGVLLSRLQHLGDRTHLGIHSGRCHDGLAGPLYDGCALEDHSMLINERDGLEIGQHGWLQQRTG
jgi:hypothetical protein